MLHCEVLLSIFELRPSLSVRFTKFAQGQNLLFSIQGMYVGPGLEQSDPRRRNFIGPAWWNYSLVNLLELWHPPEQAIFSNTCTSVLSDFSPFSHQIAFLEEGSKLSHLQQTFGFTPSQITQLSQQ